MMTLYTIETTTRARQGDLHEARRDAERFRLLALVRPARSAPRRAAAAPLTGRGVALP